MLKHEQIQFFEKSNFFFRKKIITYLNKSIRKIDLADDFGPKKDPNHPSLWIKNDGEKRHLNFGLG